MAKLEHISGEGSQTPPSFHSTDTNREKPRTTSVACVLIMELCLKEYGEDKKQFFEVGVYKLFILRNYWLISWLGKTPTYEERFFSYNSPQGIVYSFSDSVSCNSGLQLHHPQSRMTSNVWPSHLRFPVLGQQAMPSRLVYTV